MKNVKIRGIFVFIIALLLCPDICARASESVSFEFTDRYSKPYKNVWINKPVELMKNVKHVYGSYEKTILMTRDNKLYWTGEQGITYPYWW